MGFDDFMKESGAAPLAVEPSAQGAAPEPGAGFDSWISEEIPRAPLQIAVDAGAKKSPEQAARILRLSRATGLPEDLVERNADSIEEETRRQGFDPIEFRKKSPIVADWMAQTPNNAALVQDDLPATQRLEEVAQNHSAMSQMYHSLNSGLASMFGSIARSPALGVDTASSAWNILVKLALSGKNYGDYYADPDPFLVHERAPEWLANNPIALWADEQQKYHAAQVPALNDSITKEVMAGNLGKAGMALAAQFVANAPQQAAIIAGTLSGYGIPTLIGAGVTTASAKNQEAREEGAPLEQGTYNALTHGAIESVFERLGTFNLLKGWSTALTKEFGKEVSREVVKNTGKAILYSVAGEANEEIWTSVAQDFSDYAHGINPEAMSGALQRALDAGILGGVMGGGMTAPSAVGAGINNSRLVRQTQLAKDTYLALGNSVEAMKAKERLPEAQRDLIDRITQGSPIENIFIAPTALESYFQGSVKGDGAEVNLLLSTLQQMGLLEQYQQAKESGTDLKIPMSAWVDKMVSVGHYQGLANDVKFSPEALSVNELKEWRARQEKVDAAESDERKAKAEDPELKAIEDNVTEQILALGMPERQARAYGQVYAERYRKRAEVMGKSPLELFKAQNIIFQGPDVKTAQTGQGQAFEQAGDYKHLPVDIEDDQFEIETEAGAMSGRILGQFYEDQLSADGSETPSKKSLKKIASKFNNVWQFDTLQVKPEHQGKGLAAQMFDSAIREAVANGADAITLNASPMGEGGLSLDDLIEFYKSRGFKVIDRYEDQNATMLLDVKKTPKALRSFDQSAVPAPAFYSKMERTISEKMGNSATPEQIKGLLRETKEAERKAFGIDEFLEGKEKVTKEELLNHIRANSLEVKEVTLSDGEQGLSIESERAIRELQARQAELDAQFKELTKDYPTMGDESRMPEDLRAQVSAAQDEYQKILERIELIEEGGNPFEHVVAQAIREWQAAAKVAGIDENQVSQLDIMAGGYPIAKLPESLKEPARKLSDARMQRDNWEKPSEQEDTKYSKYTLPGGENYREVLFTLPVLPGQSRPDVPQGKVEKNEKFDTWTIVWDKGGREGGFASQELAELELKHAQRRFMEGSASEFQSSHWDEPNVFAHARLNDRTGPNGEKILFIEEIQSDWDLEGRQKGFKDGPDRTEKEYVITKNGAGHGPSFRTMEEAQKQVEAYQRLQMNKDAKFEISEKTFTIPSGKVPNFPFQKNWHEYTLKRIIRMAAEGGYDQVAWTTGEQQAERYDLSKTISEVKYEQLSGLDGGTYSLRVVDKNGIQLSLPKSMYIASELPGIVGKELADRIVKNEGQLVASDMTWKKQVGRDGDSIEHIAENGWSITKYALDKYEISDSDGKTVGETKSLASAKRLAAELIGGKHGDPRVLKGLDLKIGGEGKKVLYDQIIPSFMNKMGKKFGAKVTEVKIDGVVLGTSREDLIAEETNLNELRKFRNRIPDKLSLLDFGNEDGRYDRDDVLTNRIHSDELPVWVEGNAKEGYFASWKQLRKIGEYKTKAELEAKLADDTQQFIEREIVDRQDFIKGLKSGKDAVPVHSLPITPELRKSALEEGFSLFQDGGDSPRGRIQFGTGVTIIQAFKTNDPSTIIHESGHLWLSEMAHDIRVLQAKKPEELTAAQKILIEDGNTILKWMGVESWDDVKVDQHEQFARGFEAYAREGVAPSEGLRKVFAKFRAWLTRLYKQVTQLNVKLTPEVRQVFDRMLATEEQIAAANAEMNAEPLFFESEAWMPQAEGLRYAKDVQAAKDHARESLAGKINAEANREHEAWWGERREKVRKGIAEEVSQRPEYIALNEMVRGRQANGEKMPDGVAPIKINKKLLVEQFGEKILEGLPHVYVVKGGVHPDVAAEKFGYNSAQEMLTAIAMAKDRESYIDELTDRRMKDMYGDIMTDGTLSEEAMNAIHNDKRAYLMHQELKWLVSNEFATFKKLAKRIAKPLPSIDYYRQRAADVIGKMAGKDIRPDVYKRAEARAAKEAMDLLMRGDFEGAFQAKERELQNHEYYRAAVEAREMEGKIFKYMQKFRKESKLQQLGKTDYLEQIFDILNRFEFAKVSNRDIEMKQTLAEFVLAKEQSGESLGEEISVSDLLKDESYVANYREVPHEELLGIYDTVRQLEHIAIETEKMMADEKRVERDEARTQLIAAIRANMRGGSGPPPFTKHGLSRIEKAGKLVKGFDSELLKMEQLFVWMDGGDVSGPWHRFLWNPVSDAQAAEQDYTAKVTEKIARALKNIPKEVRKMMSNTVSIPGVERKMVRSDVIGAVLNMGNTSSHSKLMRGMNWTQEQLDAMVDVLTKEEMDFIQGVWNTLEEIWPDIAKLQKELTGLEPEKLELKEVVTKHGTYKGGYYPAIYDPAYSVQGGMQLSARVGNLEEGSVRATTPKGHTKKRVEGFSAPFDLDVDNLVGHIAGVVKDLTHRKWVMDANWLLSDRQIRAAIVEAMGTEYLDGLSAWRNRIANDRNYSSMAGLKTFKKLLKHLRMNFVMASMGFKATVGLSQIGGVPSAIETIGGKDLDGAKWFAMGFNRFVRNPIQVYKEVAEKSGEMRHRLDTKDRDLREKLLMLQGKTDIVSEIQRLGMMHIGIADSMVSVPTWYGAYMKALAQGKTEQEAIRLGDRAVRLSQGAGGAKDLAAVQAKSSDLMMFFTLFYTPFSALYARLRDIGHDFGGTKDVPATAMRLFLVWILAATIAQLAAGQGPDDDEEWHEWFMKNIALYPLLSIPILRDVAAGASSGYGYQMSPLAQTGKAAVIAAKSIYGLASGDEEWEDTAEKSATAASYLFGVPTRQFEITGGYMKDLLEGNESIEDLGDFFNFIYRRKDN